MSAVPKRCDLGALTGILTSALSPESKKPECFCYRFQRWQTLINVLFSLGLCLADSSALFSFPNKCLDYLHRPGKKKSYAIVLALCTHHGKPPGLSQDMSKSQVFVRSIFPILSHFTLSY